MLRLQKFHARLSPAFAERERNSRPANGERPQFASVSESDGRGARGDCRRNLRGVLQPVHRQLHAVAKSPRPAQAGNRALKIICRFQGLWHYIVIAKTIFAKLWKNRKSSLT